jgi:aspartyl-tRNA(Asn)/glutamyl-tRNA(Gln) amidotransferase subunit B
MEWESVIGLEIHIQLATKTKLFSSSATAYGAKPNEQANEVDIAIPGTLPVLNTKAVELAVKLGLGLNSSISKDSFFERKNYFYPDLPKGYQTTQLANPIIGPGIVTIALANGEEKPIRIHHAHLEEDAGKSTHSQGVSSIDLNRAGIPLIELVTEPDLADAEEAVAFATKIHSLVKTLGVCDGKMEQGSMRFDVNVSIRPKGSNTLGTRTETKNLNSFKFMKMAINQEISRQIEVLEAGGSIKQETRLFNGVTGESRALRSKEEEGDYRYFPCPDLLPIYLTDEYIAEISKQLPELPEHKKARFIKDYNLANHEAELLTIDAETALYFEEVVRLSGNAKLAANWILGTLAQNLNANELTIGQSKVTATAVADIILRIEDNTISSKIAKTIFASIWDNPNKTVDQIIEQLDLKQLTDSSEIASIVTKVITDNPQQVENYRKAAAEKQAKMLGFFVGQCMKISKGKANPATLNQMIKQQLES